MQTLVVQCHAERVLAMLTTRDHDEKHSRHTTTNRRNFLYGTALAALGSSVPPAMRGYEPSYSEELPDMMILSLVKEANALAAKWDVERSKTKTREQTLARCRYVRDKVLEMVGGLPLRNDLGGVTTGGFERDGYRVENVRFQSRPNVWVTGNLYVPTTGPGPFPAVISPSGHYEDANRVPSYQLCHMLMAKNGFVVLAYDPIGQGERRYYWNPSTGQTEVGVTSFEHCVFGQRLLLLGESWSMYRIWDGMRAIDYLLTRPEVDRERVGCTGHSGGGWATLCITLLDDRVKCCVSNEPGFLYHLWPLSEQPGAEFRVSDPDHHLLPAAWNGIDYCDVFQAIAPRPFMLTTEDVTDPQFALARKHLEAGYARAGVPERLAIVEAGDRHWLTHKLRLATVGWFSQWFCGKPGPTVEPAREPEPVKNLYVTPTGSTRYSEVGDSIHTFIVKKQANLPPERKAPPSAAELDRFRGQLLESARRLLRYEKSERPLGIRHIRDTPRRGYRIEHIEFLSEPGIYVPAWAMIPDNLKPPFAPLIYVDDFGKQQFAIGGEFGLLEKMVRQGRFIVAADLRGIGDTHPQRRERYEGNPFRNLFSAETGMAYLAWSIKKDLLGGRVLDLVRTVDYTLGRPDVDRSGVSVIASGMAAVWTLFAAALDTRIQSAVCQGGLLSYRTIAAADRFMHNASLFLPGVLHHFDLPHLAAAVAPRRLVLLSPVDHVKRPVEPSAAEQAYTFTRQTYQAAGAAERFVISRRSGDLAGQYLSALSSRASL